MFDFESEAENMLHYNQSSVPEYNISGLAVPTVLVQGGNDWLGTYGLTGQNHFKADIEETNLISWHIYFSIFRVSCPLKLHFAKCNLWF